MSPSTSTSTSTSTSRYEVVIGMECHAQLATATKLFCGCSTRFGAPPNTQVCPVCLGLPGSLPVVNRRAFEMALKTALALRCEIPARTSFDRKNYYYPDLPKNYQISQSYHPLGVNGSLLLAGGKRVSIANVHLEEDAGKNIHGIGAAGEARSIVDLNRAGIPLAEIVTGPDMRSIDEVQDYMDTLRLTLVYLGVCEAKMEEGGLRFEASISLRPLGTEEYGRRVEIKNLNSMKHVRDALDHEIARQSAALDRGEPLDQETRLWDPARGETARMRTKEYAHDYRYFPEPDLAPIDISEAWVAELSNALPELPRTKQKRFENEYKIAVKDAIVLTSRVDLAAAYEVLARDTGDPQGAANWMVNDVLAQEKAFPDRRRPGEAELAELMRLVKDGTITGSAARQVVLPEMFATGKGAAEIVREKGIAQESDRAALAALVERAIEANPRALADWKAGKQAAITFLTGQCMRLAKGKGNPKILAELLREALAKR